jgi:hypothetical protein
MGGGGGVGSSGGSTGSALGGGGFAASGSSFSASPATITNTGVGGGGGGNSSMTTATPSIPTSSNVLGTTFANPFSLGMSTNYYPNAGTFGTPNTKAPTFGKPVYTPTTTTATTTATTTTTANGFSTYGTLRAPAYYTALNEDIPVKMHPPAELQITLRGAIDRSNRLTNPQNIQVSISGGVVMLTGQVDSDRDRRVAEGLVRLTPGVRDVDNQLRIVNGGR